MSDSEKLAAFLDSLPAGTRLRVEDDLGDGFVRLRVSEAERRQARQDIRCVEDAVIEMLRNARDAHARTIIVGTSRSGPVRRIVVADDGDGVPERLRDRIFEPRVTSKLNSMIMDDWGVHGRGMALYSIRENAARAECIASVEGKGSIFLVEFDCSKTPEKSDQSTPPSLVKQSDGTWAVGSGPHNILKCASEFALANRDSCTTYLGSLIDCAATMHAFGRQFLGAADSAKTAAPIKRLGLMRDAASLVDGAQALGIDMSTRSAHRILAGEIAPLAPLLETLDRVREGELESTKKAARPASSTNRDFRGLKIATDDLESFSSALKKAYAELAESYYLEANVEPSIRLSGDSVHVVFPLSKL